MPNIHLLQKEISEFMITSPSLGDGEYIEFYGETVDKEPVYDKHGELMDYNYSVKSMVRRYRRDKFSGEYFEY